MKTTGNDSLDQYRDLFYDLSINLDHYFEQVYHYNDRLSLYEVVWMPIVSQLRNSFVSALKNDEEMRHTFYEAMRDDLDIMMWFNGFLGGPDQRKFGNRIDRVDFIAYSYQVVIGEFSKRHSTLVKKCRDMGLSVMFCGIDSGMVYFARRLETLLMSEKQDKVDVVGDRTQTLLGKIRDFLENSKLVNLKNFHTNKHLHLWRDIYCKIDGTAMKATTANGYRYHFIRCDEIGLIKDSENLINEMTMSGGKVAMYGTLKLGDDTGFRNALLKAWNVDVQEAWSMFLELRDSALTNEEIWDHICYELTTARGMTEGTSVRLDVNFKDHPLKRGNCDYFDIESAKLFHNPTAIALQLLADLDAGALDRSLQQLHPVDHFNHSSKFSQYMANPSNWYAVKFTGGFDAGGHKGTAYVPVVIDKYGFSYVLPAEYFKSGNMQSWLLKLKQKYYHKANQQIDIYSDQAIQQYEKEGSLWTAAVRHPMFETAFNFKPVPNRAPADQVDVVNSVLCVRKKHPVTNEMLPLINFHIDNKSWGMGYKPRGKYTNDKNQIKYSHPHDAFVYWCFNEYKHRLVFDKFYFKGV